MDGPINREGGRPSQQQCEAEKALEYVDEGCGGAGQGDGRYRELMRRLFEPHWPIATGVREWVYRTIGSGRYSGTISGGALESRMYLQHGEGELRVALALASEE